MRVVFLGTPDFAVPALNSILKSDHDVVAVVTQPDRAKGRSGKPTFSPVKEVAVENAIPTYQFEKIRAEGCEVLKNLRADIFVTCAYGQILSQEIIDIAPYGIVNIHASLLPEYRGAAPIQWAIIEGKRQTGISIMKTEAGIDTGAVVLQKSIAIGDNETAGELFERLSQLGASMIVEALDLIESGKAVFVEQDHSRATHVKMLKKEDGCIDWTKPSTDIYNLIRGMNPWPSAYTYYCGKLLKLWTVEICDQHKNQAPGIVLSSDAENGIIISTGSGAIRVLELQLEGSKRMSAKDFLLGRRLTVGEILGAGSC